LTRAAHRPLLVDVVREVSRPHQLGVSKQDRAEPSERRRVPSLAGLTNHRPGRPSASRRRHGLLCRRSQSPAPPVRGALVPSSRTRRFLAVDRDAREPFAPRAPGVLPLGTRGWSRYAASRGRSLGQLFALVAAAADPGPRRVVRLLSAGKRRGGAVVLYDRRATWVSDEIHVRPPFKYRPRRSFHFHSPRPSCSSTRFSRARLAAPWSSCTAHRCTDLGP